MGTGDRRRMDEARLTSEYGSDEGPARKLEDLENLAKTMLQRHHELELARRELEGWEGLPLVTAALSADHSGQTLREARRILDCTASLRHKLEL